MTWTKENIFEPSGCLTREAFEALVNDTLPVDAETLANEHLELCPFCSDALEGFLSQKPERSFAEIMSHSDEEFNKVLAKKQNKSERKRTIWLSISAAASILLLVGLFMLMNSPKPKMQVAENIAKDTSATTKPLTETAKSKEKIVENEKQPIPKSNTIRQKSEQNKVRFTPPVVINEEVSTNEIVEDKLKEEQIPAAQTYELEKKVEKTKAPVYGKLESPKEHEADFAKTENKIGVKNSRIEKVSNNEEAAPLYFVEQMPEYPGGQKAMMTFISQNLQYPKAATEMGISGRTYIQFTVDENGKIGDIKVLRGIGGGCDEEAVRVVKLMPNWKPGKQNGKAVKTYFTLPIIFALQNK